MRTIARPDIIVALGLGLALLTGCEQKGPMEKAGQNAGKEIDKAGEKAADKLDEAAKKVRDATK